MENVLINFAKSFQNKEIFRIINEIISINYFINKNEEEKFQIQEKLLSLNHEYKILFDDKSIINCDLVNSVKIEEENMKKYLIEIDQKNLSKKNIQKNFENDLFKLQNSFIKIYNNSIINENNYKHILNEFNNIKDYLYNNKNYQNKFDINNNKIISSDNSLIIENSLQNIRNKDSLNQITKDSINYELMKNQIKENFK